MADINVKIGGDTSALDKKVKGLKKKFNELGPALTIGIAGAGAAVSAVTAKIIELGDNIGKAAKRMGVTSESFQKLSFAAKRSGGSVDDVEKAFKRMSKNILDAENGLTTAKRAFEKLGLSYEDLKGKKPEEQFDIIAERLALVEDFTTKSAIAQDLFGRAGTKIIPMIDTYKQLGDELERVGGIMSNEAVAAAEKLKDDLEDLQRSTTALAANSGFIEWISDISSGLNEIIKSAKPIESFLRNLISSLADNKLAMLSGILTGPALLAKGLKKMGLGADNINETGAITPEEEKAYADKIKKRQELQQQVNDSMAQSNEIAAQEQISATIKENKAREGSFDEMMKKMAESEDEFAKGLMEDLEGIDRSVARVTREKKGVRETAGEQDKTLLADSLRRIGGSIGGQGVNDGINLDKKRNDLLKKLVASMAKETPAQKETLI